jgi:hypothetical protein
LYGESVLKMRWKCVAMGRWSNLGASILRNPFAMSTVYAPDSHLRGIGIGDELSIGVMGVVDGVVEREEQEEADGKEDEVESMSRQI